MRQRPHVLLFTGLLILTACGGGGDGWSPDTGGAGPDAAVSPDGGADVPTLPPDGGGPETGGGAPDGPSDDAAGDVTAPEVWFEAPLDGETVDGVVAVRLAATDDEGVTGVRLSVDGVERAALTAPPWEWSWDTAGLPSGTYRLAAAAEDAAGNVGTAAVRVTIVASCDVDGDCPPHSVRIVTPVEGAQVCGTVTVEAVAADDRGIRRVRFEVDGRALGVDEESPYQRAWDTTTVSDGAHTLRAVAEDTGGHEAFAAVSVEVRNDVGACDNLPNLAIREPLDGASLDGVVPVRAEASDDVGVVRVQFFVDNGLILEDAAAPYRMEWDTGEFDEGAHTLKAIAHDTAGQTAADQIQVTVDHTAPEVAIVTPEDGAPCGAALAIEATATDNVRVTRVTFVVDGGAASATLDQPPWTTTLDTSALGGGEHDLEAIAEDAAGHTARDETWFVVDQPPTVAILEPSQGDTVAGPTEVLFDAQDDVGLEQVELYVDDVWTDVTWGDSAFAWVPEYAEGPRALRVVATDSVGQTAEDEVTVRVDHPLEVTLQRCDSYDFEWCWPAEPDEVTGDVLLLAEARDDGGTIAKVELFVDGDLVANDTTEPYEFVWDSTSVWDGEHTLRVRATNSAGPTGEALVDLWVNNCDRDDDGWLAETGTCGGTDCDDGAPWTYPGAWDEPGDDTDEDCDGVDGIACDPPCGAGSVCDGWGSCEPVGCAPPCNTAGCWTCVGGDCVQRCDPQECEACDGAGHCVTTCDADETCVAGVCRPAPDGDCPEPNEWGYCPAVVIDAYEIARAPNAAAGEPGCCCDFTGDGELDNQFAALINNLGGMAGFDLATINETIANSIAEGQWLTGFELVGMAAGAADTPRFRINYYALADANGDAGDNFGGWGQFTVDPRSFAADGDILASWPQASVSAREIAAGPTAMVLPEPAVPAVGDAFAGLGLGFVEGAVAIEEAQLRAAVAIGASGYRFTDADVCGYVRIETIFGGLNEFVASQCGCLGLGGWPLIQSDGPESWSCAATDPTCDPEDPETGSIQEICGTLAQYCSMAVSLLPNFMDVDDDGDGVLDSLSVGARFSGVSAELVSAAGWPDCGNDLVESGEECDGANLAGETCETLGWAGGALGCSWDCTFDTAGCGWDAAGGSCLDWFDCANACDPQSPDMQQCLIECDDTLSPAGLAAKDAFVGCQSNECGHCTTNECLNLCVVAECGAEYAECVATAAEGSATCSGYFACRSECPDFATDPDGYRACDDACVAAGSPEGITLAYELLNCVQAACAWATTDAEWDACVTEQLAEGGGCAAANTACFGDVVYCDPATADCLTCSELNACLNGCGSDSACGQDCVESTSEQAIEQYDAVVDCLVANCPNGDLQSCDQMAYLGAGGACEAVYNACFSPLPSP